MLNILICIILLFCTQPLLALRVGAKNSSSVQNLVTFPASTGNIIVGYTRLERGFRFTNNRTTCTFDGYLPVSGPVTLNGGVLYLYKDFVLSQTLSSLSAGRIRGNHHSFVLPQMSAEYILPGVLDFDKTTLVCSSNVSIQGELQFSNQCKIDGQGKELTFNGGSIVVHPNSYLILENAYLSNFGTSRLRCLTNTSSITLRNCTMLLSSDYIFENGSLFFDMDNVVIGTCKFIYSSPVGSTIGPRSTLVFDRGTTLSYAPLRANQDLIFMTDQTSRLYFDGASLYSTSTGLHLQGGTLILDDYVTMSSDARFNAEALWLDSGLNVVIRAGAAVEIFGSVKYE
jgi:hypothetical protein